MQNFLSKQYALENIGKKTLGNENKYHLFLSCALKGHTERKNTDFFFPNYKSYSTLEPGFRSCF